MKEQIDEMGFGGLLIMQAEDGFRYGVDAVLLADFAARHCPRARTAADLGAGNGAVSLLLSRLLPEVEITAIEIQKEAATLAEKSVALNGLEERILVRQADIRALEGVAKDLDLVVANPPYEEGGAAIVSSTNKVALARHEVAGNLQDFMKGAAKLLKEKGSLCMVHRPARLVDLLAEGRALRLEAKDLLFVAPRQGEAPNQVLIRFVKGGGRQLTVEPLLYVRQGNSFTEEIEVIYRRR